MKNYAYYHKQHVKVFFSRNIDIDLPDIMKVHALDNDAFAQILEMEAGYDVGIQLGNLIFS